MTKSLDRDGDAMGGFGCAIDSFEARRQWGMSLALVIALGVAIVAALTTLGVHPVAWRADGKPSAQSLLVHPAEATNRESGRILSLPSGS